MSAPLILRMGARPSLRNTALGTGLSRQPIHVRRRLEATMATPIFYINGSPATTAHVGDSEVFDVPGQSQVWLYQTKNGATQANGPYSVPSGAYTFTANDVGHYDTF